MYQRRGFTLIELLVVIAIIAILATLVITQVAGAQVRARNANAKSDITEMGKAIELYKNDESNTTGTAVLVTTGATGTTLTLQTGTTLAISNTGGNSTILYGTNNAPGGSPEVGTMFNGTLSVVSSTYGTGVTRTPSNLHAYTYRANSLNSPTSGTAAGSNTIIWTTVTSGTGGVTDNSFCIKNGTTLQGAAPTTVPSGCSSF